MLQELKELKKISDGQKKMTKKLTTISDEIERRSKIEEEEKLKEKLFYQELTEEENNFFTTTVFQLIENELENNLSNIYDINFYRNSKKSFVNIYLDLTDRDYDVSGNPVATQTMKYDDEREWDIHIKLEKNNTEIRLSIKKEDMILQYEDKKKINKTIDDLQEKYFNIKKQYMVSVFDNIIQRSKLSRSEFLNNFDISDDE